MIRSLRAALTPIAKPDRAASPVKGRFHTAAAEQHPRFVNRGIVYGNCKLRTRQMSARLRANDAIIA